MDVKICDKCHSIMPYDPYFKSYICRNCGNTYKGNFTGVKFCPKCGRLADFDPLTDRFYCTSTLCRYSWDKFTTIFNKIQSMNIDELAEWLEDFDYSSKVCISENCIKNNSCRECYVEFLNQIYEDKK